MTVQEPSEPACRTLADRLSEGRMPKPEALRYAVLLAEALREIHDSGSAHGNVSPESVVLVDGGIRLAEKPEGQAAGVSGDIAGFGAVLQAVLSRDGDLNDASGAASTGIPALDRLIARCLSRERHTRALSIHAVLLELRLAAAAFRMSGVTPRDTFEAKLRGEMQALESRLAARLEEQEGRLADGLSRPTAAQEAMRREFAALEERLAASIESVRASVADAEDLVERVVEAMDVLHESVLGPDLAPSAAAAHGLGSGNPIASPLVPTRYVQD